MSDHGNILDPIAYTEIGKIEISNPFLVLVVPERLRSNLQLMQQLYQNSKQLVTHFDIYATLLEIAQVSQFVLNLK